MPVNDDEIDIDGQSSFQDRSGRRVCSSRSVTWSLESQTQSSLLQDCSDFCRSKSVNRNEKFSEN